MILGKPHCTAPAWADVFIAELEATGNVSAAARAAGVTPGAAYNRRTRIPGFAARWEWALDTASRSGPVQAVPLPHRAPVKAGGGMIVAARGCGGAKLVRSSRKKWTDKAEGGFLGELAASANVARAAESVGFSAASAYRRRYSNPGFALAWERAIAVGRSKIEAMLVEAAGVSLDPAVLEPPEGMARVSVSEGIAIVKMLQKTGQGGPELGEEASEQEANEVGARIVERLNLIHERNRAEKLAAGWTEAEEGVFVPPGWVRVEEAVCGRCKGPRLLTFDGGSA